MTTSMTTEPFSISGALDFGWNKAKDNFLFLVGIVLSAFLIPAVPTFTVNHLLGDAGWLFLSLMSSLAALVQGVLTTIIQLGLINVSLKICDDQSCKYRDLFTCYGLFFNYLLAAILYSLMVGLGTLLLIVPGIILAIKFQFFGYFIVDKNAGPIESLKQSWEITTGVKWKLFLFGLVIFAINLVGILCLVVGVVLTISISLMATVYVFRALQKRPQTQVVEEAVKT